MFKRIFKRNSHNWLFKQLAGFGRALNRFYENRNHDIRSNGELTVIKKISMLNPSLIVDAGANIGLYSHLLLQYIGDAKLYAFEPVRDTFQKLQKKIASSERVILVNKGLYSENKLKEINLFESNTHSSIYSLEALQKSSTTKISVELVSGDSFFSESNDQYIDFLKLDIEGAEYDALLGFKKMIAQGNIRAIQFEYGYINIRTKHLLIDFYRFFDENGYIVGKIFPKTVEFRPYEFKYEDFIGPNYLAVKKSDTELIELLSRK